MPDFERLLNQSRDVLLNPQRSTRDVLRAGLQATADVPYAEAIGNIEAQKFDRALRGYQVAAAERGFQASQEQVMWERAQAEAQRGDDNAARLLELAGAYGANAADAQRLAAAVISRTEADDINDASALPGLVAEEAARLGLEGRPELTLMSTAGGGVTGIDPLGRAQTIVPGATSRPGPQTAVAKITADLDAGYISEDQAMALYRQQFLENTGETWQPLSDEQRQQYKIPEGQPAQISNTGKVATIGRGQGVTLYGPDGNPMATIGGDLPLTGSQRGGLARDTAEALRKTNENLSELESAMRTLQEGGPDAVAISGAVTRNVGGLINQISNFFNQGDWVNTTEAQQVKSELGALFGRYIPTITAEEGGRYTEGDVARANAVLPTGQNPADIVTQSFGKIVVALETLWDIERRAQIRDQMKLDGFSANVDLTYEFGRQQEVARLMREEGLSVEEASGRVFDLVDQYSIPLDLRGLPDQRR